MCSRAYFISSSSHDVADGRYCVLMLGFYFAPVRDNEDEGVVVGGPWATTAGSVADSMAVAVTKLWA